MSDTLKHINTIWEELKTHAYNDAVFHEDLMGTLENEGYIVDIVHSQFEDSLRWENIYSHVIQVGSEYFQLTESSAATEMQESEGITEIIQVKPVQVTKTEYVAIS